MLIKIFITFIAANLICLSCCLKLAKGITAIVSNARIKATLAIIYDAVPGKFKVEIIASLLKYKKQENIIAVTTNDNNDVL